MTKVTPLAFSDLHWLGYAVMGMAAEDGIDTGNAAGHLEVHIHAIVRQYHDHLGALGACIVHPLLHVVVADAEAPVRHEVARIGDRGIGEGLAENGHLYPVDGLHDVGLEHLVAEVGGDHVLCHEIQIPPF